MATSTSAKFDQVGRRLDGGSAVGIPGAFVALPFTAPGEPELAVHIVDQEAVASETPSDRDDER
jgi:hypothetical protein